MKPTTEKNEARRNRIRKLVKAFKVKYPKQYNDTVEVVKDKKKQLKDRKYATMKEDSNWEDLDMRHALEIPEKLHDWMDVALANPDFLQDEDELHWFMKEFKQFKVPKKS